MSDQVQHEEEFEEVSLGRYVAIGAVVAVVVGVAAFFAGQASGSSSGPATLAAAVSQAQAGKLPCGATRQASPQPGTGRPNAGFLVTAVCDRNGRTGFQRPGGAGGFFRGGPGGVAGRLTAVHGSTLSIQDGQGTRKVRLVPATSVRRYTSGSLSDLEPGDRVVISGTGVNRTVTVLPSASGQ